jgi:hypothetical protein
MKIGCHQGMIVNEHLRIGSKSTKKIKALNIKAPY